ncbi:mucin-5AC-like isoform X2 [Bufo bufo]|uniref:mucin-5AC-like isoform X2 n=1 Tax=Bufo bufo TaxID=8384 RepID=UPI001ABD9F9C|nr:mucin-5AC-like isoform X2 [Bufo bufo]
MVDLKALFSLLLVAGFHFQSHSAPVDSPKPPQVPPINSVLPSLEILATIPTQTQPSPVSRGSTSNAPSGAGGNLVSSTTPRLVTVTGVKSTASPVVVTSRTENISGQPVSTSSGGPVAIPTPRSSNTSAGSINGHNVTVAATTATPRADNHSSAVTGVHSNVNVNTRNISPSPIPAFTSSQPHAPVSSGNRPGVINGTLVNPCPDQCPNGLLGNPPCVCGVTRH